MSLTVVLVLVALAGLLGTAFGYFLRWIIALGRRGSMELEIKQMMLEAREEAKRITQEAERQAEETVQQRLTGIQEQEHNLKKTEERLIKKEELLDTRQVDLDHESQQLEARERALEQEQQRVQQYEQQQLEMLEHISGLSEQRAKEQLLADVERKYEQDLATYLQKLETTGRERIEERARELLTAAIHRIGNTMPADVMTTSVELPSEEVKGKIIGKEGRNIKAFERSTGVDVIIDDTPGMITLSSFDPVRRQVARLALENLIQDGRIQPAKIEEAVDGAQEEINRTIREKGEQAAHEAGVFNLDTRLLAILGRLYFRTSFGQNVLQHSVEMAHIAGILAEELGANVQVVRAGALLHDIGKAVDHEVQGTHVEIGRRILSKFGVEDAVIRAMQAHHEEYPYESIESVIVQVADAISGSRPGARRDTVEQYLKRLADLEAIATNFSGIARAYAIQAGREIRVFVTPDQVSDIQARELARSIAQQIEEEMRYPGEIKVNVIREHRVEEFAR
jgi:ribonuclease Y